MTPECLAPSIAEGRVFVLGGEGPAEHGAESLQPGLEPRAQGGVQAVLALSTDEALSSVRTQEVASVVAASSAALGAALWRAHLAEPAFVPAFDGAAAFFEPAASALVSQLPLSADPCLVYRAPHVESG